MAGKNDASHSHWPWVTNKNRPCISIVTLSYWLAVAYLTETGTRYEIGNVQQDGWPRRGSQRSPSPEKHPEPDYPLSYATNGEPGPNDPPIQVTRIDPAGGLPRPRKRSEMAGIIRRRADGVCDRLSMCRKTSLHTRRAQNATQRPLVPLPLSGGQRSDDAGRRVRRKGESSLDDGPHQGLQEPREKVARRFKASPAFPCGALSACRSRADRPRHLQRFPGSSWVAGHLARQEIGEKPVITNWDKLLVYLRATMAHKTVEQFEFFSSTVPTCCLPTRCKTKEPSTIRRSILARS